ncbi:hypothetical protein R6Q57_018347 [Mikania cordata]
MIHDHHSYVHLCTEPDSPKNTVNFHGGLVKMTVSDTWRSGCEVDGGCCCCRRGGRWSGGGSTFDRRDSGNRTNSVSDYRNAE